MLQPMAFILTVWRDLKGCLASFEMRRYGSRECCLLALTFFELFSSGAGKVVQAALWKWLLSGDAADDSPAFVCWHFSNRC